MSYCMDIDKYTCFKNTLLKVVTPEVSLHFYGYILTKRVSTHHSMECESHSPG